MNDGSHCRRCDVDEDQRMLIDVPLMLKLLRDSVMLE